MKDINKQIAIFDKFVKSEHAYFITSVVTVFQIMLWLYVRQYQDKE